MIFLQYAVLQNLAWIAPLRDPMGVDSDLLSGRVRLRYPLTLEATHVS